MGCGWSFFPGLSPTHIYLCEETRLQLLIVFDNLHNLWIVRISDFKQFNCSSFLLLMSEGGFWAKNLSSLMQILIYPLTENPAPWRLFYCCCFCLFICFAWHMVRTPKSYAFNSLLWRWKELLMQSRFLLNLQSNCRFSAEKAAKPWRIKLLLRGMTPRADHFKASNNQNPKILMNKM